MNKIIQPLSRRFGALGVGLRLALAFTVVLGFVMCLGAVALFNLGRLHDTAHELSANWLPSVVHTNLARTTLLEYRDFEVRHARAADASYRAEYEDKLKEISAELDKRVAESNRYVNSVDERQLADKFGVKLAEYRSVVEKVIGLGRANKTDDARDISDGAAKVAFDEAVALLDEVTAFNAKGGTDEADRVAKVYSVSRWWVIGLMGGALVLGLSLAAAITHGLISQMGGEPATAVAVARAVAEGDLSTNIPLKPGDEHSLMAALRHMQDSLANVVQSVRNGSEQVATTSTEIALGNSDLSGRTEQQASALQETAASMTQLGQTVKQNADHARQADGLARKASDVAGIGGAAVTRVVETMRGINESSRKISDIIGTIDSIAFQTNILALNAAVEAARAGEQGRGFAVVASEVRSLAQRSAEAAREIKTLIAASVERVEQGSAQVDEAGSTMKDVVQAIGRVTAIVSEISEASREQSAGVAQVGQAVTQMDQTTQQNAALVEQSAAATESLRQQAQALVDVVAAFRLRASPMAA